MAEPGAVFYRGPSLLTGDPIVGIVTGLEGGSLNPKTGPMVQAWVLCPDLPPMEAKRTGADAAICGDCKLRGDGGYNSGCYVTAWLGPNNVWRAFRQGDYFEASWGDASALLEGQYVRLAAYGDPAAIPFEVWRTLLLTAAGWVGYTHAWRSCDQRFREIAMASVETVAETHEAWRVGWRTFRIRATALAPLLEPDVVTGCQPPFVNHDDARAEFVCPASDEAGHRTTCLRCQLCRGRASPARSVAIVVHGKPSNVRVFRRGDLLGVGA